MSQINVNTIKDKSGLGAPSFPNGVNATGVITATSFSGDGGSLTGIDSSALSFSGSTKVQATSTGLVITGIGTFSGAIDGNGGADISGGETTLSSATVSDLTSGRVVYAGSNGALQDNANLTFDGTNLTANVNGTLQTAAQPNITSLGTLSSLNVTGGVSIGGTLTYEDVTNVDSVGVITARDGIKVTSGDIEVGSGLKHSHSASTTTYTVKVITKTAAHRYNGTGSSLGYTVDGIESPFLTLTPGRTYKFDQADSSNNTHQIKFYKDVAKSYQSLYEEGVTYNGTAGQAGAYTQIVVSDTTPQVLHYQCVNHGHMGNAFYTNTSVINQVGVSSYSGTTYQTNGDLRFGANNSLVFSNAAHANLSYLTHNSTTHLWHNNSGDVTIRNMDDDKDVIIQTDDGSGSVTNYFVADGSTGETILYNYGNEKIKTTGGGVNVTGVCTATSFADDKGSLRIVPQVSKTSNYVVVGSDAGKHVKNTSGGWTINTATAFSIGEMVTVVNHSGSAQTLFEAAGVTLYDTADGATGDHSIKARGMATLICTASNEYYVSGNIA